MRKKEKEIIFPSPPADLSERSKQLWHELKGEVRSPGQFKLFEVALRALERADEAREIIKRDGMIVTTARSGAKHQHPALAILKEAEAEAVKIFRSLNLNHAGSWHQCRQ